MDFGEEEMGENGFRSVFLLGHVYGVALKEGSESSFCGGCIAPPKETLLLFA
ncbi:hypothetical protein CCACVL1_08224 [Corchorus capsularis]|uniref:Uncharacterized protein n=1 Tax=Corchorus capsularis TaxID=210143 RepID=A0A1R3J1N4_COCAP|nr:hypothetical protein CCACVL1_08224 [Corchorus capsularis]